MNTYPYLQEYRDQHGKLRRYIRRQGFPLVPIHGNKGSKKFLQQYNAAIHDAAMPRENATGVIYFIDDGQFIKIGFTKNPDSRAAELQVGSSRDLHIVATRPGTMRDERALHRKFAHLRHRREWFQKEPELLSYIGLETTNSWSDA